MFELNGSAAAGSSIVLVTALKCPVALRVFNRD